MKTLVVVTSVLLAVNLTAAAVSKPPRPTVAHYNVDIDNNVHSKLFTTVTLSTRTNPNPNNPILDYTYLQYPSGMRLPYRVRARILPVHLRGVNSRKTTTEDVDNEAKENCRMMIMNKNNANNNDQHGHLIAYILGGPGAWYNVVPQTRRINVGTVTKTELNSPSLWRRTEAEIRQWVQAGGYVYIQVLVAYDLTSSKASNRPTGFGIIEHYKDSANPSANWKNEGYWFSNHPQEDPDVWNSNRGRA